MAKCPVEQLITPFVAQIADQDRVHAIRPRRSDDFEIPQIFHRGGDQEREDPPCSLRAKPRARRDETGVDLIRSGFDPEPTQALAQSRPWEPSRVGREKERDVPSPQLRDRIPGTGQRGISDIERSIQIEQNPAHTHGRNDKRFWTTSAP